MQITDDRIVLRRFDDMHVHFRNGSMLFETVPTTARYAGRAIVMPNIKGRPILTAARLREYEADILEVIDRHTVWPTMKPLMTIEIRDTTTPEIVKEAFMAGAAAGKVYPRGVTTNSDEGLQDFYSENITKVFKTMEEIGMLLLLHGEHDRKRVLVTRREYEFLPTLRRLAEKFERLKIVLEHVSTQDGVLAVESLGPNVAATITAHHLQLTLNDVIGNPIQVHNACMPIPKSFDDRDALIEAATSGNPKFFLGSDSAPHLREKKECAHAACGVYSAPVLPEVLTEVFEEVGRLDQLEDFTSRFGAEFYGLPLNEGTITLIREDWQVPEEVEDFAVVPYRTSETLHWKLH